MDKGEVIIYQAQDGSAILKVKLEDESVWLSLNQMATLFNRDKSVISRYIRNIYKEQELEWNSTVAKNATVQNEDGREVVRQIDYYNLDVIISVGYRVRSKQGTQFRIWANKILKEYLVKGYVVNEKIKLQQYNDLKQTVKLLSNVIHAKELSADEATGLLQVIGDFTYALDTLDRYDYQELTVEHTTSKETIPYFFKGYIKACKI